MTPRGADATAAVGTTGKIATAHRRATQQQVEFILILIYFFGYFSQSWILAGRRPFMANRKRNVKNTGAAPLHFKVTPVFQSP
jgi:hypothetical protein